MSCHGTEFYSATPELSVVGDVPHILLWPCPPKSKNARSKLSALSVCQSPHHRAIARQPLRWVSVSFLDGQCHFISFYWYGLLAIPTLFGHGIISFGPLSWSGIRRQVSWGGFGVPVYVLPWHFHWGSGRPHLLETTTTTTTTTISRLIFISLFPFAQRFFWRVIAVVSGCTGSIDHRSIDRSIDSHSIRYSWELY